MEAALDLEFVALRFLRAAGYSLAAAAGLFMVGAGFNVIIAISAVIALIQLLNVLTYWASIGAALLLVWGGLTAAGITPGAPQLGPVANRLAEMANAARTQASAPMAVDGAAKAPSAADSVANPTAPPAAEGDATLTLTQKLEGVKTACEKKVLTADECISARAKIVADFAK
jgi:hypothetical protein